MEVKSEGLFLLPPCVEEVPTFCCPAEALIDGIASGSPLASAPAFTVVAQGVPFVLSRNQCEFDSPNYFTASFFGDFEEVRRNERDRKRNLGGDKFAKSCWSIRPGPKLSTRIDLPSSSNSSSTTSQTMTSSHCPLSPA